ncbi:hypothetical protein INR49_013958 [Caranx melampygus]|nr:hypothetical protein INR49_013958 [Caranx melampygus]
MWVGPPGLDAVSRFTSRGAAIGLLLKQSSVHHLLLPWNGHGASAELFEEFVVLGVKLNALDLRELSNISGVLGVDDVGLGHPGRVHQPGLQTREVDRLEPLMLPGILHVVPNERSSIVNNKRRMLCFHPTVLYVLPVLVRHRFPGIRASLWFMVRVRINITARAGVKASAIASAKTQIWDHASMGFFLRTGCLVCLCQAFIRRSPSSLFIWVKDLAFLLLLSL